MAKYYAVRKGRNAGIYTTWDECKKNVMGYKGASYKSFTSKADAEIFMGALNENAAKAETIETLSEHSAAAYVDGSYNIKTKQFSYGAVIFHNGEVHKSSKAFTDAETAKMRNVAGEINGSMYAMSYCIEHGIKKLTIYYDYEGIEKWCSGEWKTNKEATAAYKRFYDEAAHTLEICFVKVKGHSGDEYNDMADRLAKDALGIE